MRGSGVTRAEDEKEHPAVAFWRRRLRQDPCCSDLPEGFAAVATLSPVQNCEIRSFSEKLINSNLPTFPPQ